MKIIEVNTRELQKQFLLLPVKLYKDDPNWIRPLDKDIEAVFDPEQNKYFRHGEATRWILLDNSSNCVGRVAAFYSKKNSVATKNIDGLTIGGMGFFECINDKEAAFLLFDICKKWLAEKGMDSMEGPINFGERDKWWGLLVEGFEEPNYTMYYHAPYYRHFFEEYGFRIYFSQFTYHRKVEDPLPPLYQEKADRINRDPKYRFCHIKKSKLEKFAEDVRYIYNKAWVKHAGGREISKAQAMSMMKQLKPVLDEELVWFAYYDEEPIAFFIMIPETNQIFKYLNGQFNWLAKAKFLYYQLRKVCKKMFGLVFGVIPDFQGKGLEAAIVMAAAKKIQPSGRYTDFEMNWIGSFNKPMIKICESVGAKVVKKHITYRYPFDTSKEILPHPEIE